MQSPAEGEPVSRRFNPGLFPTDAELLSECTFLEVGPPLWVERVGVPPDFHMAFDFCVACIHKPFPNQSALRGLLARIRRKHPLSTSQGWEVLLLNPGCRFVGMSASGPLP